MRDKQISTEVILNWVVDSKNQLYEKFSRYVDEYDVIGSASRLLNDIYMREESGSTLIYENIALPHIKNQNIKKSSINIIKLNTPIKKWDENNTDVYVIIFILVRENENQEKLKHLQRIMRRLAKEEASKLLLCGSKEEIYNLMQFWTNDNNMFVSNKQETFTKVDLKNNYH